MSKLERYASDMLRRAERLEVPEAVEEQFGRYRWKPVEFVRDVLGAESATRRGDGKPYQFRILEDLAEHPQVTVRSGHGIGKSTIDAWSALWWLLTRPLSKVVIVAPEFSRQVRSVLFGEIRKWWRRAAVDLPVRVLANRAIVEGYGEEWAAIGLPATEPHRIEGFHSEAGVLLVLDETKGIRQDVYDALQGALTGLEENRLLVTSTPGGALGPFHRIWTRSAADWRCHHIPSTDSSIVSESWIEGRRRDWGFGSPLWLTRVEGEFADADEGVLFPLDLLEAAVGREVEMPERARLTLGVDVARSVAGDLNAIAVVRGPKLEEVLTWRSADTMETVDKVLHQVVARKPDAIYVDVGGPGGGVVDRLRQLGHRVHAVHFGGAAKDKQRFRNRRAELFWCAREQLEKGRVSLPDDDEIVADLSGIRYQFTADGRIQIESKDEIRKRLGRSPDRGDALALALWDTTGGSKKKRIFVSLGGYYMGIKRIGGRERPA